MPVSAAFNGRFARFTGRLCAVSAYLDELVAGFETLGDNRVLLKTRSGYWDGARVGLACQPIELPEGWLLIYHGVRVTTGSHLYRTGMALLDKNEPWRVLRRSEEWVLGPKEPYERVGDVNDVTFVTGAVIMPDNKLYLYYGAADDKVAVAIADVDRVREYIMACPEVAT